MSQNLPISAIAALTLAEATATMVGFTAFANVTVT